MHFRSGTKHTLLHESRTAEGVLPRFTEMPSELLFTVSTDSQLTSSRTAGIVCTVLGGMLSLWVIARMSSAEGWQQTWAPPLVEYEWITLLGALVAAGLLIFGLLGVTQPTSNETALRSESRQIQKDTSSDAKSGAS